MTRPLFSFLLFAVCCEASEPDDTKSWKHPEPITYEAIRAWHTEGALQSYRWPREWRLDLNQDREEEIFLGIEGYSRGMGYALFTHTAAGWRMLAKRVEGSHHSFALLPKQHDGWHDFMSTLPSGRGGIIQFVYTWDGKQYVEKSEREITSKELSHE